MTERNCGTCAYAVAFGERIPNECRRCGSTFPNWTPRVTAMHPAPGTHNHTVNVVEGYEPLFATLRRALDQAQSGKGKERHAQGRRFVDQPIMRIADLVGTGFQTGQAMKKLQEAESMAKRGESKAAEREMLGAINYIAAAILHIDQNAE